MPTLNWIGKEKIVNHHNDVVFRTLEKKYSYGEENSGNMIIHGDNLEALKALLPKYEGRIKCIYIDPPYNTGNENWVYNDNVNDPRIKKWLGEVVGKESDDLSRHDKWLCMMYPRLVLLKQLLSYYGVIFISIDDNELSNLKIICDEVFGSGNYVGIWHWYKSQTPPNLSHKIKKNLEYVLCYQNHKDNSIFVGCKKSSKSDDPLTKPQNIIKELSFPKGSINFKGISDGIVKPGIYGTNKFPNELLDSIFVKDGKNNNVVRFRNRFIWVQETLERYLSEGTTINCSKQLVLSYKKAEYSPEVPPNLIDESVGVETTENAGRLLSQIFDNKSVFPFPKHPSLIRYVIGFLNEPNAIILDSFAGSGTTAQAVLEMNKQDGGNRKFILCEMCDYAENVTAERVRRVMNGYGEGKNKVEGTGGGFDFYELGDTIFDSKSGLLNDNAPLENIREYVWFAETDIPYNKPEDDRNEYLLGRKDEVDYYLYYKQGEETTLNWDFLISIKRKAEQYIIYADRCLLDAEEMQKHNIVYKKIPRDIKRM